MSLPPWSSCSNLSAHKSCSKLLLKGRRRRPSPTHLHNHHHHCKQPTGHNPAEKSNFTPTHKITPRPRIGLLAGAPMVVDSVPAGQVAGTLCSHSGAALARWPVPSRLPPEPSHRESSHHCHHPPPSNIGHFFAFGSSSPERFKKCEFAFVFAFFEPVCTIFVSFDFVFFLDCFLGL